MYPIIGHYDPLFGAGLSPISHNNIIYTQQYTFREIFYDQCVLLEEREDVPVESQESHILIPLYIYYEYYR